MEILFNQSLQSHTQTKKHAKKFVSACLLRSKNFSVFLEGGLGTGKTFFIRECLKNLGVSKQNIISPTYVYLQQYKSAKEQKSLAHFDCYQIESDQDFLNHGFSDTASDPQISKFIEWGERLSPSLRHTFSGEIFILRLFYGEAADQRKIKIFRVQEKRQ